MNELKDKVLEFLQDKVKEDKLDDVKSKINEIFDSNKDGELDFSDLEGIFKNLATSIKLDKLGDFTKGIADLKDKFTK